MSVRHRATPIDDETFGDLVETGLEELLVLIDGVLYSVEDLCQCDGCELLVLSRQDLDDDHLCEGCSYETRAEEAHEKMERFGHAQYGLTRN